MSQKLTAYEKLFKKALRIRIVEERIIELYPSDCIQSPVHLSIGQEAVAVGVCEHLKKTDLLFSSYRSHAFFMAKGGDISKMFAELFGRTTGISKGKAGSMHLSAPDVGFMGSTAVVAAAIPHAAGSCLSAKIRGTDQIVVCVFGDGATEEGVYHETLNFIALHQLPILLICENNGLAVYSQQNERQSYSITKHAQTYGISTSIIKDGFDFEKVSAEINMIIKKINDTRKPHFVEILTCRYMDHVGIDNDCDAEYRDINMLNKWKKNDPLINQTKLIEKFSYEINQEIDKAIQFAKNSPQPGREELLQDII